MSSYTKSTDFASKDSLLTGNPLKIVKGTEIDDEFNAIQTAVNSKADTNSPTFTGTPSAPTAATGTDTTQIATTAFVNNMFAGMIVMWSGALVNIPTGWVLCDGNNSTPDLTDKFVIGAGSTYAVGVTGGSADSIVPAHTHTITDPGHFHTIAPDDGGYNSAISSGAEQPVFGGSNTSTETTGITIDEAGVDATGGNLPPYYALAYIMKT